MDKSIKILIIDDNEEILSSLKAYFTKKKYSVVAVDSGLDGLKLIESEQEGFDVIITDLVMPNVSGVAIISIVKKKWPDVPIIAITGYGEHPEALAKEAQADAVLEKPFKPRELEKRIKKLLKR
jgi:DNA-binding response OmpR family regulator